MAAALSGQKYLILRAIAKGEVTVADIEEIGRKATAAFLSGEPTILITATAFEGGSASGEREYGTEALASLCADILMSVDPIAVANAPRRAFIRADFSQPARFTVPVEQ